MRAAPSLELGSIIGRTYDLLLDFDGPICSIFAGLPAPAVASRLRGLLGSDEKPLPDAVASEDDPIEVLRFASAVDQSTAVRVEAALRDAELAAAESALPTPHAREVIVACRRTRRRVAVISNNSQAAVQRYLAAHRLVEHVDVIVGRVEPDPRLLKPHPHLVTRALDALGSNPATCALVGDSISDIQAARAAGTASIGFANKPGKIERLQDVAADAIVTSMAQLHDALLALQPQS
jgi:HAD superfamily hydrolase (TIGR01509 family)